MPKTLFEADYNFRMPMKTLIVAYEFELPVQTPTVDYKLIHIAAGKLAQKV